MVLREGVLSDAFPFVPHAVQYDRCCSPLSRSSARFLCSRVLLARSDRREALLALDALSRRFLALRPSSVCDPFLTSGHAALALVHAALAVAFPRRSHAAAAERALGRAIGALETMPASCSLYHGCTGVAWVTQVLTGGPTPEADLLAPIDAALEHYVGGTEAGGSETYDLLQGLVGIGVYALERLPRASAKRIIGRVIDRLAESARRRRPGVTWWTDPEWVPIALRKSSDPAYNLGVAHGVPGIIALLGRVVDADVGVAETRLTARSLLDKAVAWLLSQELPPSANGSFRRGLGPGMSRGPARLAWCYGDVGVAGALLVAARGARQPAWQRAAIRIGLRATARSFETTGVIDVGLCHGAAGVAHIFHRLFLGTGEPRFAEAARSWFRRLLAMREERRGFAGFRTWGPDDRGKPSWIADPGFLNGAAGVALALVAATTKADAAWDRALLLS
jgi:lantibiotic biosynthesis protein